MNLRALLSIALLTFATAATAAYNPTNPNGQTTMTNSQPVVIASDQSAVPVSGTFWQATQPVSLASVPTHAVTQSGTWNITNLSQLGGTAISMNTGVRDAGTQRVTIATNDSVPVTGTFWQATQPVSGTVTANLAAGTNNIGDVDVLTLPSLVAGTAIIGKVGIDQTTVGTTNAVSLAQIGANAVSTGNGVAGTGVQRVTVASDNTAFPTKISDGTNEATVKAASTAAVAADKALVVALSPNNEVGVTELPAAAASADGTANPTVSQIGTEQMQYNGTTWDRVRNNWETTTGDTGAKTATGNGATQTNYNGRGALIIVNMGAVSGTTPTFNVQLQYSPDAGAHWYAFGSATSNITASSTSIGIMVYPSNVSLTPGATPTNPTLGTTVSMFVNAPLPRTWRLAWQIGGTTPSFNITAVYVSYMN